MGTTAPDRPLADLEARLRHDGRLLASLAEGMGPSDWRHRPEHGGNSAAWILGHVARYRRVLLRRLGGPLEEAPWEAEFAPGKPCRDASVYPPAAALLADVERTGDLLCARVAALTAEEAAAPWGSTLPDGSSTIEGGARHLVFHEVYHLGQLGYLRSVRGKPGLR